MEGTRGAIGMTIVMTFVAGLAVLLLQANTPVARADAVTRLDWLGRCYPPVMAVGRYLPGDAPCKPSETLALSRLQIDLAAIGVIEPGERIEFVRQPRALTCWGVVLNGSQMAGWICSDASGLYRLDAQNQIASARWQLTASGEWLTVGH